MVLKLKNSLDDVEILVEYRYLNHSVIKIYKLLLSMIGILAPIVIFINIVISDPRFYSYILITVIFGLIMIGLSLFAIYLYFSIIPKLIVKRLKKIAAKVYENDKDFFSAEKIITINDEYIEVAYNNKKLNIKKTKSIFIDEFKEYIIITDIFMKNKVKKVYPLVIPISTFESEEYKKNFIRNIKKDTTY